MQSKGHRYRKGNCPDCQWVQQRGIEQITNGICRGGAKIIGNKFRRLSRLIGNEKLEMKKLIFFVFALALVTCKQNKKENIETTAASEEIQKPAVKLYTFDGGTVMVNNLELFSQDTTYHGQTKEFSDAFYVVNHPKEI